MANRDLKSVIYTDDLGNDYATKMDAAVFAQVGASTDPKVGGADYTGTPRLPPLPRNMKPRYVLCSAAGNKRRVICLTKTADLFTGVETGINLQVLGAAAVAYTAYGAVGEFTGIKHDPSQ
jgi:hypothetical protein